MVVRKQENAAEPKEIVRSADEVQQQKKADAAQDRQHANANKKPLDETTEPNDKKSGPRA